MISLHILGEHGNPQIIAAILNYEVLGGPSCCLCGLQSIVSLIALASNVVPQVVSKSWFCKQLNMRVAGIVSKKSKLDRTTMIEKRKHTLWIELNFFQIAVLVTVIILVHSGMHHAAMHRCNFRQGKPFYSQLPH